MEITLRTSEALDAIRAVAEQMPDMAVGAGTIVRADQARQAVHAGAGFLVSPGCTPRLLDALLDQAAPKHFAGSQDSSRGHLLPHRGYPPGGGRRLPRAARRRVCRRIVAYAKQSRRHTELGRHRRTCGRCQRRCPARMFSCPTARMRRPSGADWHHKGPSHVRSSRSHAGSPSAKSYRTARQRRRPPDPLSRAHRRR